MEQVLSSIIPRVEQTFQMVEGITADGGGMIGNKRKWGKRKLTDKKEMEEKQNHQRIAKQNHHQVEVCKWNKRFWIW